MVSKFQANLPLRKSFVLMAVSFGIYVAPVLGNSSIDEVDCYNAWQDSPSKAWCYISDYNVVNNNKCKVDLGCGHDSDRPEVSYTGSVQQVKRLRWCSTGYNAGYLTTNNSC